RFVTGQEEMLADRPPLSREELVQPAGERPSPREEEKPPAALDTFWQPQARGGEESPGQGPAPVRDTPPPRPRTSRASEASAPVPSAEDAAGARQTREDGVPAGGPVVPGPSPAGREGAWEEGAATLEADWRGKSSDGERGRAALLVAALFAAGVV